MTELLDYLGKRPKPALLLIAILATAIIGAVDYVAGAELAVAIFYLLPISLATWFVGRSAGIMISLVCSAIWLAADLRVTHLHIHPLIQFWNGLARFGIFIVVAHLLHNLSALRMALETESHFARKDSLTNVSNRRAFLEVAAVEIKKADRYHRPLSIAYFDLDDFKKVNDQFGHHVGNRLLGVVAETIQKNMRGIDVVARLGGDEFAILMPETNLEAARNIIERVQMYLLERMKQNNWPVTFSAGIVTFASPPESPEEMIASADSLMYTAKKAGKNMIKEAVLDKRGQGDLAVL